MSVRYPSPSSAASLPAQPTKLLVVLVHCLLNRQ